MEELLKEEVLCDLMILEGSFIEKGFIKAGVEVSKPIYV